MENWRDLVTADGARLTYRVARAAERSEGVLVFLHGAASNHTRFSELLEHTHLGQEWDTLRPDLRGNGRSMWRGRLDLATWSEDLAAILTAEGYDAATFVGHSLGAQIALDFAARFPRRTRGLVLIDPVFRRALRGKGRRLHRFRHVLGAAIRGLRLVNSLGLGRRRFPGRDLRRLDEKTREALRGGDAIEEIARRYSAVGPILRTLPTANYLQQLAATIAPTPELERIACPVLVILSANVTFADPAINREEAGRLPAAETATVDANHWPLTERPDEVRRTIEDWIARRWPR